MVNKKYRMATAVRILKDSDFSDVHVDIDNYIGEKRDPALICKSTLKNRFLVGLDNWLLKRRRK